MGSKGRRHFDAVVAVLRMDRSISLPSSCSIDEERRVQGSGWGEGDRTKDKSPALFSLALDFGVETEGLIIGPE